MIETVVRCDKCRRILNGTDVAIVVPTDLGTVYTTKQALTRHASHSAYQGDGQPCKRPEGIVYVCTWGCYQGVVAPIVQEAIALTKPPGTPVDEEHPAERT